MTALILALVISATSAWNIAPVVTWYGPGLWGEQMACGGVLRRATVGVASLRVGCGKLVRFRWSGHRITLPVIDHTGGVRFDLTRRACVLWLDTCSTVHNVKWRVVR